MPSQPNDPAQYLANLFAASQQLMQTFALGVPGASKEPDPAAEQMAIARSFAVLQQNYLKQMSQFWTGMFGAAAPADLAAYPFAKHDDKRFAGVAWDSAPGFDLLKRNYLAYSRFLQEWGSGAQRNWAESKKRYIR